MHLRFTSLTVVSLRQDLHLQGWLVYLFYRRPFGTPDFFR